MSAPALYPKQVWSITARTPRKLGIWMLRSDDVVPAADDRGVSEHRWAPPEHQDLAVAAAESMSLDTIGSPEPVDPPQPVTVHDLRFRPDRGARRGESLRLAGTARRRLLAPRGRPRRPRGPTCTRQTRCSPGYSSPTGSSRSRPVRSRTRNAPCSSNGDTARAPTARGCGETPCARRRRRRALPFGTGANERSSLTGEGAHHGRPQ